MCPRQAYCPALRGAGRSLELATKQAKNIIPQPRKVLLIHTVRACGLSLRAVPVCITALHTAAPRTALSASAEQTALGLKFVRGETEVTRSTRKRSGAESESSFTHCFTPAPPPPFPPAGLAPVPRGSALPCPALGAAPGPESPAAVRADPVSLMAPQCCLPWLRPQAPEASDGDRSLLPTGPGAGKLVTGLAPFSPSLPRVHTGLSSHLHGASPRQDGSYPGPLLFLISHPPRKAGGNYGFSFPGHTPVSSSIILHK